MITSVFRRVNFAEVTLFTKENCLIIGETKIKSLDFQMQIIPERPILSFPGKNRVKHTNWRSMNKVKIGHRVPIR